MTKSINQSQHAGDNCTLIQAGRDVILQISKTPPDIQLVRLEILDDLEQNEKGQKLRVTIKNNGDITAVIMRGMIDVLQEVKVIPCGAVADHYQLIKSDFTYNVLIDSENRHFKGQHSIASGEVVCFDVLVGRSSGTDLIVYQTMLTLEFDDGSDLKTESFNLPIAGPDRPLALTRRRAEMPTQEEFGYCWIDNIKRLDAIGYDIRPLLPQETKDLIMELEEKGPSS